MPAMKFLLCLAAVVALGPGLTAQACIAAPNASLAFDGVDDLVSVADHPALDGFGDFTIELWVKATTNLNQGLISKYRHSSGTDTDDAFALRVWPPGVLRLQLASGTTSTGVTDGNVVFADGTWHHVAVTRSGSGVTTWIDGVQDLGFTFAGTLNGADTPLVMGAVLDAFDVPEVYLGGMLDEVRLWNVHRTPAQIQQDMQLGLTGTEPGLVAYYRMDALSGQTVFDASASLADGTLGLTAGIDLEDPVPTSFLPSPLVYCGAIGGGQANVPEATLMINGVGLAPATGPFNVDVASGGTLELSWQGTPNVPFAFMAGPLNPGSVIPGVGSLDLGTPLFFNDVVFLFNGFLPPYSLFFSLGATGTAEQSFSLPALPPGVAGTFQGVVAHPSSVPGLRVTAAFQLTVL